MRSFSFLGENGVATLTVAAVAVTLAGASVGGPIATDEIDTNPDSSFYALEKAGEAIKEATYAGGQNWNIERAEERTQEFQYMASKGKAEQNTNLLDEAGNRIQKTANDIQDNKDLKRVENFLRKHIHVLENVRENVPSVAKPAITLAISRSVRGRAVLETVRGENEELGEKIREQIRTEWENMEQEMKRFREQIRENLKKGISENQITANIELETANRLMTRERKMVRENFGNKLSEISREVQNRIEAASIYSENENGLEKAIRASEKHLQVLENVYEKVPERAKAAISLAMERSTRHIAILENVKENPGEAIRETIRNRMREIRKNYENNLEQLRERIRERQENMKQIIEEYRERSRKVLENMRNQMKDVSENIKQIMENMYKKMGKDNENPGKPF